MDIHCYHVSGCHIWKHKRLFHVHPRRISPLLLDLTMLVLTVRRVIVFLRRPNSPPILGIVIRDGTWAFFLIWGASPASLGVCSTLMFHLATLTLAVIFEVTRRITYSYILIK
jgi:hypothetical protein